MTLLRSVLVALAVTIAGVLFVPSAAPAAVSAPVASAASADSYINNVNRAQRTFQRRSANLDLATPDSPAAFKKSLDRLVIYLDSFNRSLRRSGPPASVKALNDRLIRHTVVYKGSLRRAKGGLVSEDPAEVQKAAEAIASASRSFGRKFDQTVDVINRRLGRRPN